MKYIDPIKALNQYQSDLISAINSVDRNEFRKAFLILKEAIVHDQQIFVCGNGGSAAIANHLATDFGKGVRTDTIVRPRVFSLSSNGALLSAISNDLGYEETFAYQLETLAKPDDVLIAVSSSGNSKNIDRAVDAAYKLKMQVIGMSGFSVYNKLATSSHTNLHVAAENYGIIEDAHSALMHVLAQSLRKEFAHNNVDTSCFTF